MWTDWSELLRSSQNDFIASIPIYLQLTERVQLQSTPLQQLCIQPNDGDTAGNIFGTPTVE
jgi:hypothetical protein